MVPAKNRLKTDQDFQRLARKGRSVSVPAITLKYIPNGLQFSRFGFVVSVKTDKRAVVRNRVKRRIREIIRLKLAKIKPGYDIMMVIRRGTEEIRPSELSQMVFDLYDRARLLQ